MQEFRFITFYLKRHTQYEIFTKSIFIHKGLQICVKFNFIFKTSPFCKCLIFFDQRLLYRRYLSRAFFLGFIHVEDRNYCSSVVDKFVQLLFDLISKHRRFQAVPLGVPLNCQKSISIYICTYIFKAFLFLISYGIIPLEDGTRKYDTSFQKQHLITRFT